MRKNEITPIDNAVWELVRLIEERAREYAANDDINAVHFLVGESRKVQNLLRTLNNRFPTNR